MDYEHFTFNHLLLLSGSDRSEETRKAHFKLGTRRILSKTIKGPTKHRRLWTANGDDEDTIF